MSKYARIQDNTAIEVFTVPDGLTIGECFHPEVASLFSPCPDNVTAGSTVDDKGVWTIAAEPVPEPPTVTYPSLTPMEFYLSFLPAERIALKASTDPIIKEFWATYELAVQAGAKIDMALKSNQEAIDYLAVAAPAGPGIITADRVTDILLGQAQ